MDHIGPLEYARMRLVENRRQAIGSGMYEEAAAIQLQVEALDRAIADERKLASAYSGAAAVGTYTVG